MRKLLLASAAVLGGSMAMGGAAFAQSAPAPTTIPTPNPYSLLPSPTPGPGTVTVRLNVRIATEAAFVSSSGMNGATVTSSASSATSLGSPQANTKLAPYTIGTYARIFPGMDGIAGNGLKYGAAAEIRQDNGQAPGGGINGSVSQNTRNNNTLYWRREYVYVGTDQLGIVRMGVTDGPVTLFTTGTFENFNTGGWNGDLPGYFTGGSAPVWPFLDVGQVYTPQKIVYLSPQFAGFDFGASFAPNSSSGTGSIGNCPYGVTANGGVTGPIGGGLQPLGCFNASSTSTGDYARPRNYTEVAGRYRGSFGPWGVAADIGWLHAGRVADNSTPARLVQFNDLSIGVGGFQITYGGLAFGGNIQGGAANVSGGGGAGLHPSGTPDELAWVAGSSYAFGPFIVGASYFNSQSAGARTTGQGNNTIQSPLIGNLRTEWGIAAGGTYALVPGVNIYLDYLYGHRHQAGIDLLSGASTLTSAIAGAAGHAYTHNNVQAQGLLVGTSFRW